MKILHLILLIDLCLLFWAQGEISIESSSATDTSDVYWQIVEPY